MSTPEPLTWRVIEAVAAMLAKIKVADGYYTDLGTTPALTSRDQVSGNERAPFAAVLAGEMSTNEEATGRSRSRVVGEMELVVEYAVPVAATQNAERQAHRGRADIVRALCDGMRNLPLGVNELQITGSRIDAAPQSGTHIIIAQLALRAKLSELSMPAE